MIGAATCQYRVAAPGLGCGFPEGATEVEGGNGPISLVQPHDAFALESQRRTAAAQKAGLFDAEIVPFAGPFAVTGSKSFPRLDTRGEL